ncbi:mitochondrial 54S ribosomal protein bL27m Ecym_1304 [Eremothecium cymbalariae DBVPG|uniref:Large ribosomal subunit protein bL27m n=1 Tax=Eremothecium cymbalariae (strain CBS 270.75 / DBVPG 7215 / KCTC 17166 / NRRL Y-17582) TaxID=931890 RepID=G8JN78_ERECY|nr:hypothetical protein Ecym_1304 [Eremothecium cymbalariae DBVPG\
MSLWKHIIEWRGGLGPAVLVQVRTATKRAAGSRTSMKDSAGRRLGPKKYEGEEVRPGQIIMRQRGTKFFPGENVGIGKDHTIFAVEPGFVRYYWDPFHPGRKFIGVALTSDLRLPTPHFEPRVRRFGRRLIEDEEAARKEEEALPRKTYLLRDGILEKQAEREQQREKLKESYKSILTDELKLDLKDGALEFATQYLVRVRNCLKNGFGVDDAQFNALYYLQNELKFEDAPVEKLKLLKQTTDELNKSTSFDNKLQLTRYISDAEKQAWKSKLYKDFRSMEIATKEDKQRVLEGLSDASKYLSLSEEVRIRRKLFKPVLSEDKAVVDKPGKGRSVIKRYNYERGGVDVVVRSKDAFLSNL